MSSTKSDFNCKMHCECCLLIFRFCLSAIQIVDVKWPQISDGRGQLYRTVFDITCCVLVGLTFGRPKAFEIRHLATVISVKEGSLDLEKITTVNDLRIQRCLNK